MKLTNEKPFQINTAVDTAIFRFKESLPSIDLIHWLDSQSIYPKVFWKEKGSGLARASVGKLLSFTHLPTFSDFIPKEIRLYGGIRFAPNSHNDKTWKNFPNTSFWLPQIEISQEADTTQAIHYSLDNKFSSLIKKPLSNLNLNHTAPLTRVDTPHLDLWHQQVAEALEEFASGQMDKLVLARKTSYSFATTPLAWPLLTQLIQKAENATLFAFQLSPTLCFMGATPERLFQRDGNLLITEAIAATRSRGITIEEDEKLEQELLYHSKEKQEFAIVKKFLEKSLSPLSDHLEWEGHDRILKTSHVQHIHNQLKAKLKHGVCDTDLIRALHPTPALGGFPQEIAKAYIQKKELFDRGWYGAPLGVISKEKSSLYVAIRSGLIQGKSLHLFAGTGLVEASDSLSEWEELEKKIQPFTELFH